MNKGFNVRLHKSICVLAALSTLFHCSCPKKSAPDASSSTPKSILRIRVPNEPLGLTRFHDRFSEGTMTRYTVGTVYETLYSVDKSNPSGDPIPTLATSWQLNDDKTILTVHLRSNVLFHSGQAFSATDVVTTFKSILSPNNNTSQMRSALTGLTQVDAIDALTVQFTLSNPTVFVVAAILKAVPILPSDALIGSFDELAIHRAPIGTGPFKFSEWKPGEYVLFEKNEKYWGTLAKVDQIKIYFIKDDTLAISMFERGEIDLTTRVPASIFTQYQQNSKPDIVPIRTIDNTYTFIGWNQKNPALQNEKIRQALGQAFPRELISKIVDQDLEPTITCPYMLATDSCDSHVKPLEYNVERAATLLKEAGTTDKNGDGILEYMGKPLTFRILTTSSSVRFGKLLPIYQAELKKIGIALEIERIEGSVFMTRLKARDYDAVTLSWSSLDSDIDLYEIFHSSGAASGSNVIQFRNAEVDHQLEHIRYNFDSGSRHQEEQALHRKLFEAQVYLFLTFRPQFDAAKKSVHGLKASSAWYDLSNVSMENSHP
jgi:peptide/nickel transport system substrate-binding protein